MCCGWEKLIRDSISREMYKSTEGHTHIQTHRQTQTDKQTNTDTHGHIDKQRARKTLTLTRKAQLRCERHINYRAGAFWKSTCNKLYKLYQTHTQTKTDKQTNTDTHRQTLPLRRKPNCVLREISIIDQVLFGNVRATKNYSFVTFPKANSEL